MFLNLGKKMWGFVLPEFPTQFNWSPHILKMPRLRITYVGNTSLGMVHWTNNSLVNKQDFYILLLALYCITMSYSFTLLDIWHCNPVHLTFTRVAIHSSNAASSTVTWISGTLTNVFWTVNTNPTRSTLTVIARDCIL